MRKDYGTKFECYNCGAKFYDLGKPQAVCPLCDADQAKRPKRAAKKALRSYEVDEKVIDEEKLDVGGSEEALLIDVDGPDLDEEIGDKARLVVEEEEEDDVEE